MPGVSGLGFRGFRGLGFRVEVKGVWHGASIEILWLMGAWIARQGEPVCTRTPTPRSHVPI